MTRIELKELRSYKEFSKRKQDYVFNYGEGLVVTGDELAKELDGIYPKIQRITRIIHYRDTKERKYVTHILGIRGAIRVVGGFTSGRDTEGIGGLQKLLGDNGFNTQETWKVLTDTRMQAVRIDFIVES